MNKNTLVFVGFVAAIGLSACEKPAGPEDEAAPAVEEKTAVEQLREKGEALTTEAKESAESAMAAAEEKRAEMAQAASEMAKAAEAKAGEVTSEMLAQAEEWIKEAKDYLAQGKDAMAATVLEQLEKMKSSLPESMQDEIDALRARLSGSEEAASASGAASESMPEPSDSPTQQ
jgi:hypothetical protein